MSLFQRDPEEYKRIYILGEEQYTSYAMEYGSKIHKALETGKSEDESIQSLCRLVPRYDTPEKRITAKIDDIPLYGIIDSYNPKTNDFIEYKTGKTKWTQKRVDNHGQLTFYSMLIYITTKKIPKNIKLIWLRTDGQDITGDITEFDTTRDLKEVLKFTAKVKKVAKAISEMYHKEIKKTFL